jgi:uncharacterized membrane protein YeaQ/YmgE (transglycosylase-associated protein family)
MSAHASQPHWYLVPVKALAVTFILTLLSFAVGLLLGIIGTLIRGWILGIHPNMTAAYRDVALPVAIVAAVIVFIAAMAMEIRRYRQEKALMEIENAG